MLLLSLSVSVSVSVALRIAKVEEFAHQDRWFEIWQRKTWDFWQRKKMKQKSCVTRNQWLFNSAINYNLLVSDEWVNGKKPTPFFYERWIILHSIVAKSKMANKIRTCTILASIPLVLCLVVIGTAKLIFLMKSF